MTLGAQLAGLFAGVLFAACGWNKLWHPTRSAQMRVSMRRVFPVAAEAEMMWALVSAAQFGFGTVLAICSVFELRAGTIIAGLILLTICAVGYLELAHHDMMRQWKPEGILDMLACVMWTSEIMLSALIVVAIIG